MFPNVRLMIAAVVSSIVALSCGFGVFAAFRVNHEPFARLPAASESLQLVAGNTIAPTSMVMVTAGPLDHGFAAGGPTTTQSIERSPSGTARPLADDQGAAASGTQSPAAPAAAPGAGAPGAPQIAAVPETGPAATPTGAAPVSAAPPAPAPHVAVVEPAADQARASEPTTTPTGIAPESGAGRPAKSARRASRPAPAPKATRTRLATRTHHVRRRRSNLLAQYDAPHFISAQPNFQSAPRPARVRHYITSTTSRSAVGGPYVSPRGQ